MEDYNLFFEPVEANINTQQGLNEKWYAVNWTFELEIAFSNSIRNIPQICCESTIFY